MATVRVSTRDFVLAHGKEPRGQGSWAFYFGFGRRVPGGCVDPWFAPGVQTYAAAKKAAVAEAKSRGFTDVEVAS